MSVVAQEFINVSRLETKALSQSLASHFIVSTSFMLYISGQIFSIHMHSKMLLNDISKEMDDLSHVIDNENNMTQALARTQDRVKRCYQKLNAHSDSRKAGLLSRIYISFNTWLLKKTFDNYGSAITCIMEHDVDAEASYSASFKSVDDLMAHLDS
jgi:hypothetical protein